MEPFKHKLTDCPACKEACGKDLAECPSCGIIFDKYLKRQENIIEDLKQEVSPEPENEIKEIQTKKKTSLVFGWMFGVWFLAAGFWSIFSKPYMSITFLVTGLLILPPITKFLNTKWNIRITGKVKACIIVGLFVFSSAYSSAVDSKIASQKKAEQQQVIAQQRKLVAEYEARANERKRIADAKQKKLDEAEKVRLKAERAAQRKSEEEACKKDLKCWSDKYAPYASVYCPQSIEKKATYSFKWTDDGLLESKFQTSRWKNKNKLVLTYLGDKLQIQNRYGAWQFMKYACDFDTINEKVIDVRITPGRM